ncbi:hypothetical protein SAMN02910369_00742 [Lachnospiraceae bacterium NE2001]|nr:hypothetical protein SAMN02910369_00742 [Lachnospiraceae bacterium NE2001]
MKKTFVSYALTTILAIGGITLSSVTAPIWPSAPLNAVYAADGLGMDTGSTEDDTIYDTDSLDDSYYEDYNTVEEGNDAYFDYTGELDIYTGLPVGVEEASQAGIVKVNDDCTYDLTNHYFVYQIGADDKFCASVVDGMVTTAPVNFAAAGEFNMAIYKDGVKLNGIPQTVSEPGSYTAITWDDNSEKQVMTFQIVKSTTGKLAQYVIPSGFSVQSVEIDGVEADKGFGMVDMTREGYYDIRYACNATGIVYNLVVSVDHIPPQITIDGVDKNNKAKGPVTIQGLQNGDSVVVYLDDKKTSLKSGNKLTESGTYKVLAYDQAGNVTQKDFEISLYLNIKSVFLFIAFVVLIAGIIVALYITRKRLRVR